jgi:hypothetical protein
VRFRTKLINVFSRIEKSEDTYYILLSKYVSYDRGADYAILKAEFDFTEVIDNMSKIDLGIGGQVTVYDKNYDLVYASASSNSDIVQEIALLKKFVVGHATVSMNGHSFFVYANTISNTSWRIAIFANTDYINTMTNTFLTTISLISLVLFYHLPSF